MEEEFEFDNIWSKYGLKDSPYNVKALSLIGTFDIEDVFFGRKEELKMIGNRINSNESSRTAIVGEIGTGKTTFANYLRWLLAKKKNIRETRFLTIVEEIKIKPDWDFNQFLRETLFEIYNSSERFGWEKEGIKLKTLEKIKINLDIFSKINCEITGETYNIHNKNNKNEISSEILQQWFYELCEDLKGYEKELVLHYNNLETLTSEKLSKLLMSIKDLIQRPYTHWLFLGPVDILSTIENLEQVHSIFNEHLFLEPLSKEDLISILEARCKFLSKEGIDYIKPYDENTVLQLYDKLNGNIRFIFKLLEDVTSKLPSPTCKATIHEINIIQERKKERILSKLTDNERKLIILLMENEEMPIGELGERLNMRHQNVSKEIKSLKKKTLIMEKENPDDKRSKLIRLSQKTYLSFVFSKNQS